MKRARSSFWSRSVGALMVLAALMTSSSSIADGVPVPVELQATLLAKVVTYDRKLAERSGDRVHVLLVGKPSDPMSMPFIRQMHQALGSLDRFGTLPHDEEIYEFTNATDLVQKCRAGHVSIVYFGPGFHRDVDVIRAALEPVAIMTVTAMPEEVPLGIVLGFDLVYGKPKLLVHLTQARKQRVELMAEVLKLMRVIE